MNNPESDLARKIVRHLDAALGELRPGTVYRLQQARAAALARAPTERSIVSELATAGSHGPGRRMGSRRSPVGWLGLALLVAATGFGYQQWQAMQHEREYEDLDLHLLASDLPIDAYLDRGFQNWLRTGFER
jgi:hypothetical protein